jgi:hypothetical protein
MKLTSKKYFLLASIGGSARDPETGNAYEVLHPVGGACAVRSKQTGRHVTLDWQEVINLAVKAGIDLDEDKEVELTLSAQPTITN